MKCIALLLFVICTACGRNYNGMDISHHNAVNWDAVKNDGNLEFCYIKSTEGSTLTDRRCRAHLRKAKDAGLKVGLYHYFSSHSSGKTQFENFNKCLQAHQWDLIPVVDIETPGNDFSDIRKLKTILSEFLDAFHAEYDYYPIVYYGDLNAYRLCGTAKKCKSWYRTVHFSQFLPPVCFQQVAVAEKYGDQVDLNYCKNLDYILVGQ
jgi:Lyzozyme M1 (1,4-beta-N-acetylmuramidase)